MDFRTKVFRITRSIWLGPFASPERKSALTAVCITHILNVGEAPNILTANDGQVRHVIWHPIIDLELIPEPLAVASLESLHQMLSGADARVYVHCIAGLNRSPTVVWLYLVACGIEPAEAKAIVEKRAPDAIAGHSKLVDAGLVAAVQKFGSEHFLPHPRPDVLIPAD
jgi:protein-tyrosine phosphatase